MNTGTGTHPAINAHLYSAMLEAVEDIGEALTGERAVDLEVIRSIQSLRHLTCMADIRLKANALPIIPLEEIFTEGAAS